MDQKKVDGKVNKERIAELRSQALPGTAFKPEAVHEILDALEAALARAEGGKSLYVVMERHPNGSLRHLFHHIKGERFLEVYVGERLAEDLAKDWCRGPSWSRSGNRYFEAHPFEGEEAQSALRTATEPRP